MRGMCDAPSRALARRRRPSVPRPHSLTHEPQAGPSCIPSLMDPRWAYLSVFVFDFNTLGVVHVPHLRKPTAGGGDGTATGRARVRLARRASACVGGGRLDTRRDVREVAPSGAVEQR